MSFRYSELNVDDAQRMSILDQSFRDFHDDSGSAGLSRIKPFFEINSSQADPNTCGLIRLNNVVEPEHSFRLILRQIDDSEQPVIKEEPARAVKPLTLHQEISSPALAQVKDHNAIFEEVLKTPQKSQKPFARLLLRKYNANSHLNKLNLSSGDCQNIRGSDISSCRKLEKEIEQAALNTNKQISFKFNFSSVKNNESEFDFEPEDGESELMYKAKISQNVMMQQDKGVFKIKPQKPVIRSLITTKKFFDDDNAPPPQEDVNKTYRRFNTSLPFNHDMLLSGNQNSINYSFLKIELRNVYNESLDVKSNQQIPEFLRRLFFCTKKERVKDEFGFIVVLSKINPDSPKSKYRLFYRLADSVCKVYAELAMNISVSRASLFDQQKSPLVLTNTKTTENEQSPSEIDAFKADLLQLNLTASQSPCKFGLLSVMMLIEFLQEFFEVVAEIKELLECRKIKFSEIHMKMFPRMFKSFKLALHKIFIDGEKLLGLKFYFTVAFFVVLRHIRSGSEVLSKFDKMWSCIETRIQGDAESLRRKLQYGRKSSLEAIFDHLPNY